MRRVVIALAGVAAVACGIDAGAAIESTSVAATAQAATAVSLAVHVDYFFCRDDMDVECVEDVVIGPDLVDCVGVAPMRCMVVDGELFYDEIEGFEHEAKYRYRIRMERYDPWDGKLPPADASWRGYRLMEVLEKARVRP